MAAMERRGRIGRRGLLGGAAAVLGTGAFLETASLRGRFDHRRPAGATPEGAKTYADALRQLDLSGADDARALREAAVVHIGHSTHLMCVGGLRFLTDPWFHDPAFGALVHEHPLAVLPTGVGRLDVILITHDHADHADIRALDQLDKRAIVIVATSDLAARIRQLGYREAVVLAPWEERKIGEVTITAVPALHDIYEIGFVVKSARTSVYFAGDTRLFPELAAIAERFSPEVSILPVDGTRLIGGSLHVMTPEDAVTAARTLKSRLVIPSHAEAVFSDPLVANVLASTVAGARFLFGEAMGRALPGVRCVVPASGELIAIGSPSST